MIAIYRNVDMLILIGQGGSVSKRGKNMKEIIIVAKSDNGH
jgi:hypothetical protein